jgi:RNA polymerase sigma-70 factor (ECF subfamily)
MKLEKEFERFYQKHIDKVFRFIFFRVGGNREVAEDLVSEVFIKALKNFEKYDETLSGNAWIMTIAKNHVISYWRDQKISFSLPGQESEKEIEEDAFWLRQAIEAFKQVDNSRYLADILAKLNFEEREIVTFHYLFGYSYKEIADEKGVSEGAVKVAAHRALKKMKGYI